MPFVIYARKSSESEDRQVLSIDSQIKELKELANSRNLDVVQVFTESRSAKTPGREVFNSMFKGVLNGQYGGILCWKLDRLARNPVDGAQLIQALEQSRLKQIATPGQTYHNTTNDKFSLSIELCLAKRYVDDLSDNIRRGNRAKLEQGWLPGPAPLGYLNEPSTKTIVKDPERFVIIRKIWDMVLNENKTVPRILQAVNHTYGFRTRKSKRLGNRPLSRSGIYKLLSNPFYYGLIVRNGEAYQGSHSSMVSKEEFDQVQSILKRPGKPKPQSHYFPYTGLIRCGECGAMVTAEKKVNRFGSRYIYYHCTKRKRNTNCSQACIRVEELEKQLSSALQSSCIHDDFKNWAINRLRVMHQQELCHRGTLQASVDRAITEMKRQLDTLIDLRLRQLLTDGEYMERKRILLDELAKLKEKRNDFDGNQLRWLELSEKAFNFANQAQNWFEKGMPQQKREIIACFGSNLTLKDRILLIEAKKPFLFIKEGRDRTRWCWRWDSNPQGVAPNGF